MGSLENKLLDMAAITFTAAVAQHAHRVPALGSPSPSSLFFSPSGASTSATAHSSTSLAFVASPTSTPRIVCTARLRRPLFGYCTKGDALRGAGRSPTEMAALPSARSSISDAAVSESTRSVPSWEELSRSVESVDVGLQGRKALDKKIVLYRDTNAWCPFCLRVWLALKEKDLPFETVLIDLGNKPKWFTDLVPTAKVPAITIDGELTYESLDILWKLEKEFPEHSFLPEDRFGEIEDALSILEKIVAEGAFFKWLGNSDGSKEDEYKQKVIEVLDLLEDFLRKRKEEGPFILGKFSLADCAFINPFEGAQHRLAYVKNFSIRNNDRFPLISEWFKAIDSLESYQAIRADARTSNVVLNYFRSRSIELGQESPFPQIPTDVHNFPGSGFIDTRHGAIRAALKLISNHKAVVEDGLKSERVHQTLESNIEFGGPESPAAKEAVDFAYRLLVVSLLAEASTEGLEEPGQSLELPSLKKDASVIGHEALEGERGAVSWSVQGVLDHFQTAEEQLNPVGIAALEHIAQRVCVPRDMPAGAKVRFVANALGIVDRVSSSKSLQPASA